MPRVRVALGRLTVSCALARTASEQAQGLQGWRGLAPGQGMLFTFAPPRRATFHMGRVEFPIDLVFVDANGRVGKVVHGAQPGARERWSMDRCSAVVEVPAGTCSTWGVRTGLASSYNPTEHIVMAGDEHTADDEVAPGDEGYYQAPVTQERPPGRVQPGEVERESPNRFEDRNLSPSPESMGMGGDVTSWNVGSDSTPSNYNDGGGFANHDWHDYPDGVPGAAPGGPGGNVMSASLARQASANAAWYMQLFAEKLRDQWRTAGPPLLEWRPVAARGLKVEAVEVTAADIQAWIHQAATQDRALRRLRPDVVEATAEAFTSSVGLPMIQAALEASGAADRVMLTDGRILMHRGADPHRSDNGLASQPL